MTELQRAVDRLVGAVRHWSPDRWTRPAGTVARATAVHALVQRLADADADVSGRPRRAVPRLDNDLALPDQVRVLGADLSRSAADRSDVIATAAADIRAVSALL